MENILPNIAAIFTALFGVWAYVNPIKAAKLLYLTPRKQYGISEIRATYGAFMIGIGGFALYSQSDIAFQYLGITYLVTAFGRSFSHIIDKAFSKVTIRFVVFEVVCGVLSLF